MWHDEPFPNLTVDCRFAMIEGETKVKSNKGEQNIFGRESRILRCDKTRPYP